MLLAGKSEIDASWSAAPMAAGCAVLALSICFSISSLLVFVTCENVAYQLSNWTMSPGTVFD